MIADMLIATIIIWAVGVLCLVLFTGKTDKDKQ